MKKIISLLLSFVILVTGSTVTIISASADTVNKTDYLHWAQDDSSKPWYSMSIARDKHSSCTFAKYGCWIMSYAKLLVMTRIKNQDNFGPVDMINWIVSNKITDNEGNLIGNHQNIIANNFNIKYEGQIKCSGYQDANSKILEQVQNGNFVLVRMNKHTVIVDNEMTLKNGYATVSNSWKNSNYNVPLTYFTNSYSMEFIDVFRGDTISPTIANVDIDKKTKSGYGINCTVTDNVSVGSVEFVTYKNNKIVDSGYGSKSGDTWNYTFSKAIESGSYYTKIIAVDTSNNVASSNTKYVDVKCRVGTPKITVTDVSGGKVVTVSSATSKSKIYYKIDDGKYKEYSGKIKISSTKKITAYAVKSGYYKSVTSSKNVTVGRVSAPTVSIKNSIGGKTVSLRCKTNNSAIYYKTSKKGSYKKYSKPFKLSDSKTVYAYAKKSGSASSKKISKKIKISTTSKPNKVKASAKGTSSVKVSWKSVKGASGYYVYQSDKKNGKYKKVATVKNGSSTSKTVNSLSLNKTYYFKIKAYTYGKKTSAYSSCVSAKIKSKWGTLKNVKLEKYGVSELTKYEAEVLGYEGGGSAAIFVNFSEIKDADGFEIKEIWSSDYSYSHKVSIKDSSCSKKCILFSAQEFPKQAKIRAYKKVKGKTVYGPYKTINYDSAKYKGNLYYDEYENLCHKRLEK